jgi:hypothetical protein
MTKIKFNIKYRTIEMITNSNKLNRPVHLTSDGLYIDNSDIETVTKILDRQELKYELEEVKPLIKL